MDNLSKAQFVIQNYLNENGESEMIKRYDLPQGLAWTSGDSPFRSDGYLGRRYKIFRYSATLEFLKKSICWYLTDDDKEMITQKHTELKLQNMFTNRSGRTVEFLQFYGKADEIIIDEGIRNDIRSEVCRGRCVNCNRSSDIQCDHKNDLKNDPRVLEKATQRLEDFQPLCRNCNILKREYKVKMLRDNRRIGGTEMGYSIDFIEGDFTLDKENPNWYIGTYWGDCLAFKRKLIL